MAIADGIGPVFTWIACKILITDGWSLAERPVTPDRQITKPPDMTR